MRNALFVSVLCLATISLAAAPATPRRAASLPTTHPSKHPAIVHIVSRDKTLTISSGLNGLLYSLAGEQGKVLVADASGDAFARLYPELYHSIRNYIAVQTDASVATSAPADEMQPIPDGGGALPVGVPLADLDASR